MATVVVQQARQTDAPRFLSLSRNELLRRKLEAATLANRGTAPTSTDWERSAAASGDLSDDHRSREPVESLECPPVPHGGQISQVCRRRSAIQVWSATASTTARRYWAPSGPRYRSRAKKREVCAYGALLWMRAARSDR